VRALCRYADQGKLDKAIEFYEKALSINIKVLGEEHPIVASSYMGLGMV
jgi:tetratricopeptide (TPR) repeat protein